MPAPMPAPPQPAPSGAWLRSPAGLGRATAVLLGLVVATDLFACFADFLVMSVAGDAADGALDADLAHRADRADTLYATAGVAQGAALVATAVVYLCWLWRVRVNAEVFDASRHSMKRGWVIGGWFCPVVNLWFPRRIVLDCWEASAPWGARGGHAPVNAWWSVWIGSLLVGRAAYTQYDHAGTPAELRDASRLMLFSDGLDIAAAVLAAVVVVHMTRLQNRKVLSGELLTPAFG
ncbi:hypothetical protein GCM10010503_02810 [Streptomyces lucensis JCM 4490]|uniref:DUF4328 domain-containing protein n=2 Tax=Streptomyces lucensis TaxID=67319 RepID=A0A918IUF7_9ACTN|nr:hypothetical protein GCM10010503_02810 [Streptomyces lucensis JCM 4490]